jgi:hypothetical protein
MKRLLFRLLFPSIAQELKMQKTFYYDEAIAHQKTKELLHRCLEVLDSKNKSLTNQFSRNEKESKKTSSQS